MATYGTAAASWTTAAHADGASSLANNSYHALRTTSTSTLRVIDIYVGGMSTSSVAVDTSLRRVTTNGSTPTDQTPSARNPLSQASTSKFYVAATTGPTIASTVHLLNLGMNAFGGIVRWVAAPGEEIYATASTQPNGEMVLDAISGVGVLSTTVIFEEM